MSEHLSLKAIQKEWHGSLKAYLIGFFASLLLTLLSFGLVYTRALTGYTLLYSIVALACIQMVVQVLFFLHVGQEAKPRWETIAFLFMLLVLVIIVGGTLWIMHDLNSRMMSNM